MDAAGAVAVAQVLAGAGLAGGVLGGIVAGVREPAAAVLRWHVAFLVHLGVVSCVASTWAGTLEIVPLALIFATAAGIVPFVASFFALRHLARALRARRRAPSQTGP
jgi:hypothetical protein